MSKRTTRVISALSILSVTATCLSGCVTGTGELAGQTDTTLADAKEVKEFYAEELKGIDMLETHVRTVEDSVAFMDMSEEEIQEIYGYVQELQGKLNVTKYEEDVYLTKQMHDNVKAVLSDKVLLNGEIKDSKRTRDMYVMDIEYDMVMRGSIGGVADEAKFLGLNGAFKEESSTFRIDTNFLNTVYERYKAAADEERRAIEQGLAGSNYSMSYQEASSYIDFATENYARYNNVLGANLSTSALMPPLDFVFMEPAPEGVISGVGIRQTGNTGLNEFGFDRNSMQGKATVRYIYKEDSATGNKNLDNVYVLEYEFTEGIPSFEKTDIFPEFAETEIESIVERADRVICNSDITGMSNGQIFGNKLFAIEYGNKQLSAKQIKYGSKISEELKRKDKLWLVKVDTKETEEVKYANKGPAQFQEVRYIVLEQYSDSFIIVDEMTTSRKTIDEPAIDYGDTNTRRFNSLYNSGNISDESKTNIKQFMQNFYDYCTNTEWQAIADSICSDTKLLSRSKKTEMYYDIRSDLIKTGNNQLSYTGAITDWLGGSSDPQVEFKTIELLQLANGESFEVTKYYLVSVFNDEWVINDIKVLTREELKSQDEVSKVSNDIQKYLQAAANDETKQGNEGTPENSEEGSMFAE